MTGKCVIISGGEYTDVFVSDGDFVIACDKGVRYASACNIVPDLIIGDFDSYHGELPDGVPVIRLKCEKDDTDTMTALRYAVDNGFGEVVVYCALGGRLDHAFANIQSCAYACGQGLRISLFGCGEKVFFITNDSLALKRHDGFSLSLFSVTDECTNVCVNGAKYPLDHATLTNSFPLGVSNEWAKDEVKISVGSGILMVMLSEIR